MREVVTARLRHARPDRRTGLAFAAGLGALAALGQVPFDLAVALPAGLVGAMVLLSVVPGPRSAGILGWVFGAGYFVVTLHWLVEPFLVDAARHGWMAPFALVLMAGGLALFWAAAFAGAAWLRPSGGRPVALVLTLGAAEWLRSVVLTGFPWALIGYSWVETPVVHAASLVGPHGLTLLTLLLAAGIAEGLRRGRTALCGVLGAVPLVAVASAGWLQAQTPLGDGGPIVRLVQPNAPQDEKWSAERAHIFVQRLIDLTADGPRPDLIVWPETAIPYWLDQADDVLSRAAAAADGVPLVMGVMRREGPVGFNSLVVVGEEGRILDVYDKQHLVPFGEYIPLGGVSRWMGLRSFAARDGYGFSGGTGPRVVDLGALGRPMPLICYEAIFPHEVGAGPRPDWLLQITNDAWFGTFSGPYQHLAQARMRSVEQGLPSVRVANTGVSAVIDARGRIVLSLPLGEAGAIDAALPPAAPPTAYSRTGDAPLLALVGLGLIGFGVTRPPKPS